MTSLRSPRMVISGGRISAWTHLPTSLQCHSCNVPRGRGKLSRILEEAGQVVVEPGDAAALAKAVGELADDPRRRGTMGADGRRAVTERFDRQALARRYRSLLAPLPRASLAPRNEARR